MTEEACTRPAGRRRVMVIGCTEEGLGRLLALLARPTLEVVGHVYDGDVLATLQGEAPFDVLVVAGGVEPTSRPNLVDAFLRRNPEGRIVEHFGGPHGLVEAVEHALHRR